MFTGTRADFSHSRQNLPCKSHTAGNSHSIQVKPCPFQHTCWRSSTILNQKMGAPANWLQHKQHIPPFIRRTYTNGQTNKNKMMRQRRLQRDALQGITRSSAGTCCVYLQGPLAPARSLRRTKVKFTLTLAMVALRGSRGTALLFLYPWR